MPRSRVELLSLRGRGERRGGSTLWNGATPGAQLMRREFFGGEHGHARTRWDTPSGIVIGAGDGPLSVDLKAYAHVREGTLEQVTFHVAANGDEPTDVVVSAEAMRVGNFTDNNSPLPGVASGLARVFEHGFDLDPETVDGGIVRVSATVRTNRGGVRYDTHVDPILIYNDADGIDRRPCTATCYVSPTGSEGNNGLTPSTPKQKIGSAWAVLTTAAGGSNIRGGRIVLQTGAHVPNGAYSFSVPDWHSADGYVEMEFEAGASLSLGGQVEPDYYFSCKGAGKNTHCGVRVLNARVYSEGFHVAISAGVLCSIWFDGGSSGSVWDDGSNLVAKFYDDGSGPVGFEGNLAGARAIATGHRRTGVANGFLGFSYLRDCAVERWLGIAYFDDGPNLDGVGNASWRSGALWTVNCYSEEQDYLYDDGTDSAVQGLVDYTGGTNFVVSAQSGGPHNGKLRLTCVSAPPNDIFAHAAGLVGSTTLGFLLSGFDTANNGAKAVLEAGAGYMILNDAAITAQNPAGASARIVTSNLAGAEYYGLVHPDIWRVQGDKQDAGVQGLGTATTVRSTQALFSGGQDLTRYVFDGVTTPDGCRNNFDGSILTDCTFRYLTLAHDFGCSGTTAPGSVFHDSVIGTHGGIESCGFATLNRLHIIGTGAIGTNGTSGAWFQSYPDSGYLPKEGARGMDSGLAIRPDEDLWESDVAWTQGAGAYGPGLLNWGDAPTEITGAAAGTIGLAGNGAGAVAVSGAGSGTLPLAGSGAGAAALVGTAAGDLPLAGAATATVAVAGAGAGTIPLAGDSAGALLVAGGGAGDLPLGGVAAGIIGSFILGTGGGAIDLGGDAAGAVAIAGVGSGELALNGSGAGVVAVPGLVGAGVGVLELFGDGFGVLAPLPTRPSQYSGWSGRGLDPRRLAPPSRRSQDPYPPRRRQDRYPPERRVDRFPRRRE